MNYQEKSHCSKVLSKFSFGASCSSDMIEKCSQFQWNMKLMLRLHLTPECDEYAVLVLNSPIHNPETAIYHWQNASFRMAIDGGGNVIHDLLRKFRLDDRDEWLPHVISGDFDSIRNEVLTAYQNREVEIIHNPDQDETDFFKGLKEAVSRTTVSTFIVLCENEGRFDHIMSNVNTLFKASKLSSTKNSRIFLLTNNSIMWLLRPGNHTIRIPSELWNGKSDCSLIPIGQPCQHVTTAGLKWNLKDDVLQFGGVVSSSNRFDITNQEPLVTVQTDNNLIWSMSIN